MRRIFACLLASTALTGAARAQPYVGLNSGNPTLGTLGAAPQRVIVCNRNHPPDDSASTAANFQNMSRMAFFCPSGATDVVVCYAGWHMGPEEYALAPTNSFVLSAAVASGGSSGFAVNDIVVLSQPSYATTPTGSFRPARLRVAAVSSGVITAVAVEDGGIYNAPLASPASQASTTGSGAGTPTFTLQWGSAGPHIRVGIEPNYNATQSLTGINAIRQVTWGGASSAGTTGGLSALAVRPNVDVLIPPGQTLCSDPVRITIPVGGEIAVRTFTDLVGGAYGYIRTNAGDYSSNGAPSVTDNSNTGTALSPESGSTAPLMGPLMILGVPIVKMTTFAAIGDSITWGSTGGTPATDEGDQYGDQGWFQRAVGPTNPLISFASASNELDFLMDPATGQRSRQLESIRLSGAEDVGWLIGVNDLRPTVGNFDENQVMQQENQLSAELRTIRTVKKIWAATNTPYATDSTNTVAHAACVGKTSGGSWTGTNGIQIRNFLLRDGNVPRNGTSGGTYAVPPTGVFTTGASSISTGAQTVTPNLMTAASGGANFAIAPGVQILVNPGGGDAETVTVTASNDTYTNGYPTTVGTTFTATFANSHVAGEPMVVYSPYYHDPLGVLNTAGLDFIVDFGLTAESSLGSCLWVSTSMTGDGLHPSYLTETTGGHATLAAYAAPIFQANQ